ncbi:PREDICTED: uncharacterized protein LOC107188082 [Dufourea novaeangliae]|uniref:Death ligand signal enhancer n=1 Tax=Dufourea novaeangliae TaxID=178035 RepID=A0A154PDJ3_DUFNO|nr:PREDICTED: uncharacterized protein LOC107188082 [Dufourea novaeangliae]KZC09976.1 hypothetical protein WN55_01013 [Dufourea novaeangliae]
MWKFVTRGIRETLEFRACRTNVYSQTSQDNNAKNEVKTSLTCNQKFLAPTFSAFNKETFGSTKTGGTKDKNQDSKWNTKYTWSDAVGWSSVLAVGWAVCQTLCLRRRIFEKEKNDTIKSNVSQCSGPHVSYLLGHVLNLRPMQLLPVTNCVGNNNKIYVQEEAQTEWKTSKPFGPITIEEALKEATEEFANIHKLTMGEYELRHGLKALEEKRYQDAIKHFTAGAKLSSVASMFNLGLCYELGLGTLVDQKKAAKYYNDAAEQGHADATYNLGVFYAQGRGGFLVDVNRARNYFVKAAKLGQSQAQHALDLEKRHYQSEEQENSTVYSDKRESTLQYLQNTMNINHILKKLTNYSHVLNTQLHVESFENSDCKHSGTETKNPTEIFLDILGINEPNILPVSMGSNNCSVPC